MNEILVPSWIKERQAENALRAAQEEASKQRQIADSLRIQKDAPIFYAQLIKELARNTDALPRIKLQGNTASFPGFSGESSCRVSVAMPGNFPRQTYTDVTLFVSQCQIRCLMLDGGLRRYYFCVVDDCVKAIPETPSGPEALSAEQLAEEIVKRMVDHVSRPSLSL